MNGAAAKGARANGARATGARATGAPAKGAPTRALAWLLLVLAAACAGAPNASAGAQPVAAEDTTGLVPPGFGTLRQDDIAIGVALAGGVNVRVIPLDESIIRLLSPDSYRALHEQVQGRAAQLRDIARRNGFDRYSVWQVQFFGTEQGEARFSPQEVIITSGARDYRPLDLVPLTPGFGEQRLRQRATQTALYVFDGTIDLAQPQLSITVEGVQDASWGGTILPRIERERALVRSRVARGTPTKAASPPPRPR